MSRPARGAWIEMQRVRDAPAGAAVSRPARGAWIEMTRPSQFKGGGEVAPRKGRVD